MTDGFFAALSCPDILTDIRRSAMYCVGLSGSVESPSWLKRSAAYF